MSTGIEKKWPAVAPQLFTANGTAQGLVTVNDARGFKVKQEVVIIATGQPTIRVQIKRFNSAQEFVVGPITTTAGRQLTAREDLTAYTVAAAAFIYAEEQNKSIPKSDDIDQAVYEQEPTVAIRSFMVNEFGQGIDTVVGIDGKIRLATDTEVTVEAVDVAMDAFTKVPPDNAIAVGTEDGTKGGVKHALKIDANGNANVINMGGLVPKVFDDIVLTYGTVASQQVVTVARYYVGGSGGTLVATLTLSYDLSANLTEVART